jgi:hypothetical protein
VHHLTTYLQQVRPSYLHCHSNCLISTHIIWRIVLSFCKMTVPYPGYRIIEEVYMKYEWEWGRHFVFAQTSKLGRDWKEFQSWRCTTYLSHCSSYVRHTSSAILFACFQLTYFDSLSSDSVKWHCLIRVIGWLRRHTWSINTFSFVTIMHDPRMFI